MHLHLIFKFKNKVYSTFLIHFIPIKSFYLIIPLVKEHPVYSCLYSTLDTKAASFH